LRIGENDFSISCNFKELHVAKKSHIQLSRYRADIDLFGRYTSSNMIGVSPMALALQFESADTAGAAERSTPV
jgi:hypothetical protein